MKELVTCALHSELDSAAEAAIVGAMRGKGVIRRDLDGTADDGGGHEGPGHAGGAGGVAIWYGSINGVRVRWFFDSGASTSFISPAEVQRCDLSTSKARIPIKVRHSSGEVEFSDTIVRGARLKLAPHWTVLVDLYVLKKMPPIGLILGTTFMHEHAVTIEHCQDMSVTATLTAGRRRVTIAPGNNETHETATAIAIERIGAGDISERDETYLCFLNDLNEGYLTAVMATKTEEDASKATDGSTAGAHAMSKVAFHGRLRHLRKEEGITLTPAQQTTWDAITREYADIFEEADYLNTAAPKLGERLGVHHIPFEPGAELPRPQKRGHLSDEKVQAITDSVRALLGKGYIEPSDSPLAAPVVLVRKPDGRWRFCVDFRAINHITRGDSYMPPKPDTLYPQMKGAKVFARMDCVDGFFALPIAERDRWKTAFQTPIGLYQFKVAAQGLKGSPAQYQRYMDQVLAPYIGKFCTAFVDDICVWADSVEQMTERLKLIFAAIRKHNLKLKPTKCEFFLRAVRFLGHIVDGNGMSPDASKVEALIDMPVPETVADIRTLLGVVGFLRGFVPDIAEMVAPLQAFTKKGARYDPATHSEVVTHCKNLLVDALLSPQVLALPDARRRKAIMTDASNYAMGAVLLQDHTDEAKGWRPVAYLSKLMSPMQLRQGATGREFFAMTEAVSKWAHELANQTEVTIYSDHRPLEALGKQPKLNNIILRRLDEMDALDLRVSYRPAAEVGLADWLSRRADFRLAVEAREADRIAAGEPAHPMLAAYTPPPTLADDDSDTRQHHQFTVLTAQLTALGVAFGEDYLDAVAKAQAKCEKVKEILARDRHSDEWRQSFKFHGGLLWSLGGDQMRLIIPHNEGTAALRRQLITEAHDAATAGHLGPNKTFSRLNRHVQWRGMRAEVIRHCQTCNVCQRVKPSRHRAQGMRWPLPIPRRKWAWVSLDLVKLEADDEGFDAALVVVDKLTKRTRFIPCKTTATTEDLALLFYTEIFKHHGWPVRLVSDRDPKFVAEMWQELWRLTGTTLNMSAAYHPQTDGQSEGAIRILSSLLRSFVSHQRTDWRRWLPSLEFAYNDSVVRTTGATPFELEYGQHPITPMAMAVGAVPASATIRQMRDSLRQARQQLVEITAKEAAKENEQRKESPFKAGDWAYVRIASDVKTKLEPLWEGPFLVTGVSPNNADLRMPGRRHKRFNVQHLRRHEERDCTRAGAAGSNGIVTHRYHVAEDSVLELQFKTADDRWHSADAIAAQRWPDVRQYCAGSTFHPDDSTGVGKLVRKREGKGRQGRMLMGIVCFYDPDDGEYQIRYENGLGGGYTFPDIEKYGIATDAAHSKGRRSRRREWAVERILSERLRRGRTEFLVRWEGFDPADDSWQQISDFDAGEKNPSVQEWRASQAAPTRARDAKADGVRTRAQRRLVLPGPTDRATLAALGVDGPPGPYYWCMSLDLVVA